MGNELSVNENIKDDEEYQYEKTIDSLAFGNVKVFESQKTKKKFAQKNLLTLDNEQISNLKQDIFLCSQCSSLLKVKLKTSSNASLCSSFCKVTLYSEYTDYNLLNSKFYREKGKRIHPIDYNEDDYYEITLNALNSLNFLHTNQLFHGGICPEAFIFDSGKFKFLPYFLFSLQTSFEKMMSRDLRTSCFLSPEEFLCLEIGEVAEFIDRKKCDVFSLGMTLLCVLEGYDSSGFYDFSSFVINFQKVQECLLALKPRLSFGLFKAVSEMLQPVPSDRISVEEAISLLSAERRKEKDTFNFSASKALESTKMANSSLLESRVKRTKSISTREISKSPLFSRHSPTRKYKIMVCVDKDDEFSHVIRDIEDLNSRIDKELNYEFSDFHY